MRTQEIQFPNQEGKMLSARLEWPVNQKPHNFALFAHCFTCGKSLAVMRNLSRALNLAGFAVLRFDFTGLGDNGGNVANANFSSNVEDLLEAARYLATHHQAPALLIGHSLGGSAVISAAHELPYAQAVVTIGAPCDPGNVSHLFSSGLKENEAAGVMEMTIAGKSFPVKKQFLEDIREQRLALKLKNLKRALLIMHSPQDRIVAVENAARIYQTAMHPKSFISLDGADHMLSNEKDSQYAGEVIASWARRYINLPEPEALKVEKEVAVRLGREGYTTEVMVRHHSLTADEPERVGGNDYGPSPYELVSAGLGACTAITLQMYARRKKWDLKEVIVHLEHYKDYTEDSENPEDPRSKIDHFDRLLELEGDLDETQRQRLLEIANKCPVHRTLHNPIRINTKLKEM